MLLAFAVTLPWTVVGFWNAAIGLTLMVGSRNAAGVVAPNIQAADPQQRIEVSTALLACVRGGRPLAGALGPLSHTGGRVDGFWAGAGAQRAGTGFGGDACRTGGGMKCPRDASAP